MKNLVRKTIRIVQKILIAVFLFLIYFIGFGITFIFAIIFNRRLLGIGKERRNAFWVKSEGYEADMEDSLRQS